MLYPITRTEYDKISDMKSFTWPLAATVIVALLVVAAMKIFGGGDTSDVLTIILVLLGAYNTAEIREVKANTNGAQLRLMEENANYRRQISEITTRALDSPPLGQPQAPPQG